jgi:hypothetical protein
VSFLSYLILPSNFSFHDGRGVARRPNVSLHTNTLKQVLINTIRSEIASCSERAYPSLPIANAKNLLFLDSEGAVVQFAQASPSKRPRRRRRTRTS